MARRKLPSIVALIIARLRTLTASDPASSSWLCKCEYYNAIVIISRIGQLLKYPSNADGQDLSCPSATLKHCQENRGGKCFAKAAKCTSHQQIAVAYYCCCCPNDIGEVDTTINATVTVRAGAAVPTGPGTLPILAKGALPSKLNTSAALQSSIGSRAIPAPRSPYYTGVECYPQSVYPAEECPFVGMCLPGSTCTTWRSGLYSHLDPPNPTRNTGPLRDCPCGADCAGRFVQGRWTPDDAVCPAVWLTSRETFDRLDGRRIVFSCDSLMRQVFLRAIAHLRGLEAIAEHFFDGHAVFAMNGTHDLLSLHDELIFQRTEAALSGPRRVEFEFRRMPYRIPSKGELDATRPQVLVTAVNIHCNDACFDDLDIPGQLNALLDGCDYLEHIVRLTTANRHGKFEEDYSRRNAAMRAWAAAARGRSNVTVMVVGLDKLAEASPWGRNTGGDDAHFQCSFLDQYPAYIRKDVIKTPDSADCRDLFNLNVLQLILGRL